ncbi:hypothetical protein IC620_16550 [Hazenella sp. IB182357]|uniref:Uncharacterized protein n=1 Tax=Polycladospora coralii TaxID=2771432 RepID=A0A926N772_9BACL|nr:hypothetical protein [Polycladospora coralii]MBD1373954.1 hypothetical protein [Polycladospora coralii]
MAASEGVSKESVRKEHPNLNIIHNESRKMNSGNNIAPSVPSAWSMHEITITQNVRYSYKPRVQIFTWFYNSGSFREMKRIEQVGLNYSYGGISKQFTGNEVAKLYDLDVNERIALLNITITLKLCTKSI